jgi:hypothetical protein
MNRCLLIAVLAFAVSSSFAQAVDQARINKTFRELRSLPDGTTEMSTALPLVKTLVRLDPTNDREYFDEYLKKIVPEGPLTAQAAIGEAREVSISLNALTKIIEAQVTEVQKKMRELQNKKEIDIAEMFKLQIEMNRLTQLSDAATNLVSAANSSISLMARNVKS